MKPPLTLRKLKADMVIKGISLITVAEKSGVPYCMASEILNGRRVDALRLSKLRKAIDQVPMPKEEIAQ